MGEELESGTKAGACAPVKANVLLYEHTYLPPALKLSTVAIALLAVTPARSGSGRGGILLLGRCSVTILKQSTVPVLL